MSLPVVTSIHGGSSHVTPDAERDELIRAGWEMSLNNDFEGLCDWAAKLFNWNEPLPVEEYQLTHSFIVLGPMLSRVEEMIARLPPTMQLMILDQFALHGVFFPVDFPDQMLEHTLDEKSDISFPYLLIRLAKVNMLFRPMESDGQLKEFLNLFLPFGATSPFHEYMIRYCLDNDLESVLEAYVVWYSLFKVEVFALASVNEYFQLARDPGSETSKNPPLELFRPCCNSITESLKSFRFGGQSALAALMFCNPAENALIRPRIFDSILRLYPMNIDAKAIVDTIVSGSAKVLRRELESTTDGIDLYNPAVTAATIREVRQICTYINDTALLDSQPVSKFLPAGIVDVTTSLMDLSLCTALDAFFSEQFESRDDFPNAVEVFTDMTGQSLIDLPYSPKDIPHPFGLNFLFYLFKLTDINYLAANQVRTLRYNLIAGRPMKAFDTVFRFLVSIPLPSALVKRNTSLAHPYVEAVDFPAAVNLFDLDPKVRELYRNLFNARSVSSLYKLFLDIAYKIALCNFTTAFTVPSGNEVNIADSCLIFVDLLEQLGSPKTAGRHMARLSFLLKIANVLFKCKNLPASNQRVQTVNAWEEIVSRLMSSDGNRHYPEDIQIAQVLFDAHLEHWRWLEQNELCKSDAFSFNEPCTGNVATIVGILKFLQEYSTKNDISSVINSTDLYRLVVSSCLLFNVHFDDMIPALPESDESFVQYLAATSQFLYISPHHIITQFMHCLKNDTRLTVWIDQLATRIGSKMGIIIHQEVGKNVPCFLIDKTTLYLYQFMLVLNNCLNHYREGSSDIFVIGSADSHKSGEISSREPGLDMVSHSLNYYSPIIRTGLSDPIIPMIAFYLPGATLLDGFLVWLSNSVLHVPQSSRFPPLPARSRLDDGRFPHPYADPDMQNGHFFNPGYSHEFLPVFAEIRLFNLLLTGLKIFYGASDRNPLFHFVLFLQALTRDDIREAVKAVLAYSSLMKDYTSVHIIDVEETGILTRKMLHVLRNVYRHENRSTYFSEILNLVLENAGLSLAELFSNIEKNSDDEEDTNTVPEDNRSVISVSYVHIPRKETVDDLNSKLSLSSVSDRALLAKTLEFVDLQKSVLFNLKSERDSHLQESEKYNDVTDLHRGCFFYRVFLASTSFSFAERIQILDLLCKYWKEDSEEIGFLSKHLHAFRSYLVWMETPMLSRDSASAILNLPIGRKGLCLWPSLTILDTLNRLPGIDLNPEGCLDVNYINILNIDFVLSILYRLLAEHELPYAEKFMCYINAYAGEFTPEVKGLFYLLPLLLHVAGFNLPTNQLNDGLQELWWKSWLLQYRNSTTLKDLALVNNSVKNPILDTVQDLFSYYLGNTLPGSRLWGAIDSVLPVPKDFECIRARSKLAVELEQKPWSFPLKSSQLYIGANMNLRDRFEFIHRSRLAYPALDVFTEWLEVHLYSHMALSSKMLFENEIEKTELKELNLSFLISTEDIQLVSSWIEKSWILDGYLNVKDLISTEMDVYTKCSSRTRFLMQCIYRHNILGEQEIARAIFSAFLRFLAVNKKGASWNREMYIFWAKNLDFGSSGVLSSCGKLFKDYLVSQTSASQNLSSFPDSELLEISFASYFCFFVSNDQEGIRDILQCVDKLSKEWRFENVGKFFRATAEFESCLLMSRRLFKLNCTNGPGAEVWPELMKADPINPARMSAAVELLVSKYGLEAVGMDHRNDYFSVIMSSKFATLQDSLHVIVKNRLGYSGCEYLFGLEKFWCEGLAIARAAKLAGFTFQGMNLYNMLSVVQLEMSLIPSRTRLYLDSCLSDAVNVNKSDTPDVIESTWLNLWILYSREDLESGRVSKPLNFSDLFWSKSALNAFIADSALSSESEFSVHSLSAEFGYSQNRLPMPKFLQNKNDIDVSAFDKIRQKIAQLVLAINSLIRHSSDDIKYVSHQDLIAFIKPREDRKLGSVLWGKVQKAAREIYLQRHQNDVYPATVLYFAKDDSNRTSLSLDSSNMVDFKNTLALLNEDQRSIAYRVYIQGITPDIREIYSL